MNEKNHQDAVDDFIEEHHIIQRTGFTHTQARDIVSRAMTGNQFTFVLADVVNSFLMDSDLYLGKIDKAFSHQSKQYLSNLRRHVRSARFWSEKLTQPMYHSREADNLCYDADWWLNFIKLVDDRIGTDSQKTHQLLTFLINMPEGNSPYKVTLNDFQNP